MSAVVANDTSEIRTVFRRDIFKESLGFKK